MKYIKIFRIIGIIVLISILLVTVPQAQAQVQRMITVNPAQGKIGDSISVTGSGFTRSTETTKRLTRIYFSSDSAIPGSKIGTQITRYKLVAEALIDQGDGIYNMSGGFSTTFKVPAVLDDGANVADVQPGIPYNLYFSEFSSGALSLANIIVEKKSFILTASSTLTPTPTPGPVVTPEPTPAPSPMPIPILTPTPVPIPTPVPLPTPTSTPAPAPTPAPVPIATPIAVPTPTPTVIPTPTPAPVPTPTPQPAPTPTPTPVPAARPTPPPALTPAPTPPAPSVTGSIEPVTGHVGSDILIAGAGFKTGATLTIKYDDEVVATVPGNASGILMASFKAPVSKNGSHTVTASDGTSSQKFTFTMESAAPRAPEPVLPEMGAKVKLPVSFDWKEVTDDSPPVTYTLQVATSKDFALSSILLEKKGLTRLGYTLGQEEQAKLTGKGNPYFWRVRVTDAAANDGVWTGAREFSIVVPFSLPGWARYGLFVLGGLLLFVLGFWLGRITYFSF